MDSSPAVQHPIPIRSRPEKRISCNPVARALGGWRLQSVIKTAFSQGAKKKSAGNSRRSNHHQQASSGWPGSETSPPLSSWNFAIRINGASAADRPEQNLCPRGGGARHLVLADWFGASSYGLLSSLKFSRLMVLPHTRGGRETQLVNTEFCDVWHTPQGDGKCIVAPLPTTCILRRKWLRRAEGPKLCS